MFPETTNRPGDMEPRLGGTGPNEHMELVLLCVITEQVSACEVKLKLTSA